MRSWIYEINDVLLIQRKEQEVLARVADYIDSLDDRKPLYVNLRCAGGLRWSNARIKIQPSQIIRPLPDWYTEQKAKWDAELKAHCDPIWAKMLPAEKERVHQFNMAHGLVQRSDTRSPIERMVDKACGIE